MGVFSKKFIKIIVAVVSIIGIGTGLVFATRAIEDQKWQRLCNGNTITGQCQDEEGNKYAKYVSHPAEAEKTKQVYHAATPEKYHYVHHDAEYGTRQVQKCIKTNISNKNGTCALSQCWDGMYSGSTGRGTCSYHGGVARSGGPWYYYETETYLIKAAWDEKVVDEEAKPAYTETVVVEEAKEAWIEKVLAK